MRKIGLILAAFLFCAQAFLACSNSESFTDVQNIAEPQTAQEDVGKIDTVSLNDSTETDTTAPEDTSLAGTPALEDTTRVDSTEEDTTEVDTTEKTSDLQIPLYANGITSGNLYLFYPADSFLTRFELGDIITVAIDGYDTLEMPVAEYSSDVPIAGFLLSAIKGYDYLTLTMHNGYFGEIFGIAAENAPINVTISMKEKGGFLFGLEMSNVQNMYYYTENYPDLSIEEFANFRNVRTTGMGKNKLYRSSSPIDPCLGRNYYADSLAKEAGIATFINLADSENSAKSFRNFDRSYYATQDAIFLALPVEFFSKPFQEGLVKGFRFMIDHEGPYLAHCTFGMDRTGFTIAVLEALMGATSEDLGADYAKTFSNYYNVVDGKQVALTEKQVDFFKAVVVRNLQAVYHAEGIEVPGTRNANWAKATEKYLEKIGLTPQEISDLKDRLK